MAKGNHSFYEEVKKSDESGHFSFSKFFKGIRKYGKWILFSFLTVVTLWGCAAEFIHTTTQQVSRGLEFYGNKQEVVPNMYKGQESTFSYQIVATGDNPFTDLEEDNFLLPFEIYRPNYNYLMGIDNENIDPENIDYNLFTTPGKNIADYQISLLSSTANLSLSTYYSTAFLGYDWSNVDLINNQYLIMPFNIDYFSDVVKKQFYQYSLSDSNYNLENYDIYNQTTNPYGNDNEEIDAIEFYAYLADNNSIYSEDFLSYIQPISSDENDNVIDSNGDDIVNGDDYYSTVQKGFAYYTGPLLDFSTLDPTSEQTFSDSYDQVGNVNSSDLINPLNWAPVNSVIYLHQLSEDQNEDPSTISEDKYNLYQSEVKLYTNILAYYGGINSQTGGDFNSINDNFAILTANYQYDFEKIIDYELNYSDQDQTIEDIEIPSNVDRTVDGIISYIFYQDSSPPSPGNVDYTSGFNFLISPYALNILNSGIWQNLESTNLVVGTSYDVINSRSVSDPSEVFYPSQKSMQLITGYNYENNIYDSKTTYQSAYDYDLSDEEEYTTYEDVDVLRPSDWMDGTKAGQANRTDYSGWAFMEKDQNNDWQLIELASNKAGADTTFDANAFLYFASASDFNNNNFDKFFTIEGQNLVSNYLIDYSQYINIGYEIIYHDEDNNEVSDLSEKSVLIGNLNFYTPFIGISSTFDTDSQSSSIDPLIQTTADFGITASLYNILNQAEGDGLNNNHEVFTDDIGDWQDAWDPEYGPMYGLFVWPLAQLSIIIQSIFPIGAVWGVIIGIFLITFILRGIGYAMSFGSNKNQSKMQEVQTQVAQINAKYQQYDKKNKQMKMRKQQETMALYRKNNVNPFASLGTIFVTMPIFLSIWIIISALPAYKIISVGQFSFSVSAISGMFSVGSLFFAYLFVGIAVGFSQGLSSKLPRMLSNKRKGIKRIDEQTKKAMKKQNKTQNIMIGVFIFMGLIVPVLLAIYWIFSALFTMTTEIIKHAIIQHKAKKEV
ncbi:/ yidC / Oxa1Ec /:655950 Reverse [Candidatus Hepatoplasma crinochetorum]|uniref:/ yidC / Oxa1Ec /:655950 Reverse n=1 Tax=Candidatus Hepatoplasma crinochetorum TaxID=295596 RepID=A0A0G7ZN97_9MOLU|nr:/ yidC / Oxa1Ec /:655950 Reverse [Candidatus Hepatoplasma crinochetorum]